MIFPAFALALVLPYLAWTNYWAWTAYLDAAIYGQFAAILIMSAAVLLFFEETPRLNHASIVFFAFWFYAFLSVLWSIDFTGSIENAISFGIYFFAMMLFWRQTDDFRQKSFFYTAIAFCAGTAILPAYLGFASRTFGGITANAIAHIGFTIIVLSHYGRRWIPQFLVIGMGLILYAQGRTVLASTLVFLIMYYGVLPITYKFRARMATVYLLISSLMIIGLFHSTLAPAAIKNLSNAASVQEDARLGGDFTGRTSRWEQGLREWDHSFFLGNGLSTRGDMKVLSGPAFNAHSGAVNLVLDLGLIGALIFIYWYLLSAYISFNPKLGSKNLTIRTSAAFFVGYFPNFIVEPNYISLYHPSSLALFFALTSIGGLVDAKPAPRRLPRRRAVSVRRQPSDLAVR